MESAWFVEAGFVRVVIYRLLGTKLKVSMVSKRINIICRRPFHRLDEPIWYVKSMADVIPRHRVFEKRQ